METIKKLAKAIKEQADPNMGFLATQMEGLLWFINYIFTQKNKFLIISVTSYDEDGFEVIPEFDEQELQDEVNG